MRKYRFKFQHGGVAQGFVTPVPNIQTQAFTPLIQTASQPLDTGFDSMKLFESLKLQKKQEERLAKQDELSRLQLAASLEAHKAAQEDRILNRIDKVKDPLLNTHFLPGDIGIIEDVKREKGLDNLYAEATKNPNSNTYSTYAAATKSILSDPRVVKAMRRKVGYDILSDKLNQGYYKDRQPYITNKDELDKFATDSNQENIPEVKVDEDKYQADFRLSKELTQSKIAEAQSELQYKNQIRSMQKPYLDEAQALIEQDPVGNKDEILKLHDTARQIASTTAERQQKDLTFSDLKSQSQLNRFYALRALPENKDKPDNEIAAMVENEFATAKKGESSDDINAAWENKDMNGFWNKWGVFNNGNLLAKYRKPVIQAINQSQQGGSKLSLHYADLDNNFVDDKLDNNTTFVPDFSGSSYRDKDGKILNVQGVAYRLLNSQTDKDKINKLTRQGWITKEKAIEASDGVSINPTSNQVLLAMNSEVPMYNPLTSNATASTTKSTLPDHIVRPKTNPYTKEELVAKGIKINDPTKWDNFVQNVPKEAINAIIDLKKIVGAPLDTLTGYAGDEYNHHKGPNGPYNFDLGTSTNAEFDKLIAKDPTKVKEWAKAHNYALIREDKVYSTKVDLNSAKPGDILPSAPLSDAYSGPHYHLEYTGLSNYKKPPGF